MSIAQVLAAGAVPPPASVNGGPLLGLFVTLMAVAAFFLWRSMNKRLRRMDQRERELSERDSAE